MKTRSRPLMTLLAAAALLAAGSLHTADKEPVSPIQAPAKVTNPAVVELGRIEIDIFVELHSVDRGVQR